MELLLFIFCHHSGVSVWQCLQPQRHWVASAIRLRCFSPALLCKLMHKSSEQWSFLRKNRALCRKQREGCMGSGKLAVPLPQKL